MVKEKHGDLDKAVCPSTPQCEEYARRRIMIIRFRVDQEPLSIDAVRRFSVDFMAWGWTDRQLSTIPSALLPVTRSSR